MNLEKYIENLEDIEKFYYLPNGRCVYLHEKIGELRYLVSDVSITSWNLDEYYGSGEELHYGQIYLLENTQLFGYKNFKIEAFVHDSIIKKEDRIKELDLKIKDLSEQEKLLLNAKNKFENDKNSIEYNSNTFFKKVYELINNQKRYLMVIDSKWRYYLVDLQHKKLVSENDTEEWNIKSKYKKVEIKLVRDLNDVHSSQINNDFFNFNVDLIENHYDKHNLNIYDSENIIFFDSKDELQNISDELYNSDKIDGTVYLSLITSNNLNLSTEFKNKIRSKVISSLESKKNSIQSIIDRYDNDNKNYQDEISKFNSLDLETIDSVEFHKLIKGLY